MKLTDTAIRALKPPRKPRKLFDGEGLYLLAQPNGTRLWRLKYRYQQREKTLSIGQYPEVSLRLARDRRHDARKLLAEGIDPSQQKQLDRAADSNTFEHVANEWLDKQEQLSADTRARIRARLKTWAFPAFGRKSCDKIEPTDVLGALSRVERLGTGDTAHRTRADIGRVMRYAVATSRASSDVTRDLKDALKPIKGGHFAAITTPKEAGELLRAIEAYAGQPSTQFALKLAPHVFLRPGELRGGKWSEIDFDAAEWRVPKERMKGRRPHLVPLSRQVIELLRDLKAITGDGELMFPSVGYKSRPISDNTMNGALRRMGYDKKQMTAHGFRSMASSLLNERGESADVIELQLAHKPANRTRAIYNRSEKLDDRRALMQRWSDKLDSLRASR